MPSARPENYADRLLDAIDEKGSPICVGVDPRYDRLPAELQAGDDAPPASQLEAIRQFCATLIEVVAPLAPAVKPQVAYFERYGAEGLRAYFDVVKQARDLGLVVIGDVKRGDIGPTAEAYAAGHLAAPDAPDAVTVNGYFGSDGLAPFVDAARRAGRGLFVLVRTSNPSAATIQDFADAGGTKFYEHIAAEVAAIGAADGLVGRRGYSCVGAVVGATWPDEARRLRRIMPRQIFLLPGYGAQGATAADCAAAFDAGGAGAIVNASRSVIYAHQRQEYRGLDWTRAVEQATRQFADDIAGALGSR